MMRTAEGKGGRTGTGIDRADISGGTGMAPGAAAAPGSGTAAAPGSGTAAAPGRGSGFIWSGKDSFALLIVFAAGVLSFLPGLGSYGVIDPSDCLYAEAAREMLERGDWLTPTANYQPFYEKPILIYWMVLASYKVFGVSPFAARLPEALCGIATVMSVFVMCRQFVSRRAALFSALALLGTPLFVVVGHVTLTDGPLTLFMTVAALGLLYVLSANSSSHSSVNELISTAADQTTQHVDRSAQHVDRSAQHVDRSAQPVDRSTQPAVRSTQPAVRSTQHVDRSAQRAAAPLPVARLVLLVVYTALALIMLSKGPVPIAFLGLIVLTYLALVKPRQGVSWYHWWRQRITSLLSLSGIAIFFALAAPWYVAESIVTHGAFAQEFFIRQNLGRAVGSVNHQNPFWYYIPVYFGGLFPWSVVTLLSLPWLKRLCWDRLVGTRSEVPGSPGQVSGARSEVPGSRRQVSGTCGEGPGNRSAALVIFSLVWLALIVGIFTCLKTKLATYILPAAPAVAIISGVFLDTILRAGRQAITQSGAGRQAITQSGAGRQAITQSGAGRQAITQSGAGRQAIAQRGAAEKVIALSVLPFIVGLPIGVVAQLSQIQEKLESFPADVRSLLVGFSAVTYLFLALMGFAAWRGKMKVAVALLLATCVVACAQFVPLGLYINYFESHKPLQDLIARVRRDDADVALYLRDSPAATYYMRRPVVEIKTLLDYKNYVQTPGKAHYLLVTSDVMKQITYMHPSWRLLEKKAKWHLFSID